MKTKYERPKDIDNILEQLNLLQEAKGEIVIPGINSPFSERLKFKLCQQILKFKMKRELTNSEMAKILNTNQTRISEICRCQFHLYTIDRLIDLVQILATHDKELKTKLEKGIMSL
jgi:predicted XRE-type DNA-binding protein